MRAGRRTATPLLIPSCRSRKMILLTVSGLPISRQHRGRPLPFTSSHLAPLQSELPALGCLEPIDVSPRRPPRRHGVAAGSSREHRHHRQPAVERPSERSSPANRDLFGFAVRRICSSCPIPPNLRNGKDGICRFGAARPQAAFPLSTLFSAVALYSRASLISLRCRASHYTAPGSQASPAGNYAFSQPEAMKYFCLQVPRF